MKILLGMSGGLDSTYAALKLQSEGHTVEGAVLVMHDYTETKEAKAAADSLGIPLHVLDCREAFRNCVIDNFAKEYLSARTPNPCIICNAEVKLRHLYDFAMVSGFDKIATGHYAEVVKADGGYAVKRGADLKKDQSYMLWRVSSEMLSALVLPLAHMEKSDIRQHAQEISLAAADKEESQEICFIPDNDYASYIEKNYRKCEKGSFVSEDGKILGEHKGILHYTVGQRRGLGIAAGERMFITEINAETNTITLAQKGRGVKDTFEISDLVFTGMKKTDTGTCILDVKTRYLSPLCRAELTFSNNTARVRFLDDPKLVTPGQSAVFYRDGVIMLGGFIN